MSTARFRTPAPTQQELLDGVELQLIAADDSDARGRFSQLIARHHYLKSDKLVGEQLRYAAVFRGQWVALLSWCAAARQLKDREQWIGWSPAQRRERLSLIANNARFLVLPGVDCPNLASRVLALCQARLSADWQAAYGHPVLIAESFVDSQLFRGTCYKAQGWQLLGRTRGCARARQDFYTEHQRPKQLWVRELQSGARRLLAGAALPDDLRQSLQSRVPHCQGGCAELGSLMALCQRRVPDFRKRKGRDYPIGCLLAIMVMAALSRVVLGQRDLAAFAAKLTQRQLRALRSYRRRDGRYDYPKETTFQRVLAKVDAAAVESLQQEWLGQQGTAQDDKPLRQEDTPRQEEKQDGQIAIDGKSQRGSTPHVADEQKPQLVSAQSQPGGRVLGTVRVESKSNEIPAARQLLKKLGPLDGTLVMLDALHSNQQTLRQIVQDNGADYLVPVKGNHDGLRERIEACLRPDHREVVIPPLGGRRQNRGASPSPAPVRHRRKPRQAQPRARRAAQPALDGR